MHWLLVVTIINFHSGAVEGINTIGQFPSLKSCDDEGTLLVLATYRKSEDARTVSGAKDGPVSRLYHSCIKVEEQTAVDRVNDSAQVSSTEWETKVPSILPAK